MSDLVALQSQRWQPYFVNWYCRWWCYCYHFSAWNKNHFNLVTISSFPCRLTTVFLYIGNTAPQKIIITTSLFQIDTSCPKLGPKTLFISDDKIDSSRDVTRALIGGCLFIYSYSAQRISFENLSWFQKKSVGHNTNIWINTPPPQIIAQVTSLISSSGTSFPTIYLKTKPPPKLAETNLWN